jgi:glycosyltransferase involved in cell wall biosynthesis
MSSPEPVLLVMGDWDGRGGLQRYARDLIARWPERRITVLTWHVGWRRKRRVEGSTEVVSMPALYMWTSTPGPLAAAANTAVTLTTGVLTALQLRRRWRVAYAAGLHPEGTVAVVTAALSRRRAVVGTWLTGPLGNVARARRGLGPAALVVARRARWSVAETAAAARELRSAGFARVRVVAGGVDLDRFRPPTDAERAEARRVLGIRRGERVVVCCCRLDLRQKRVDVLLDAWARVRRPGWRLLVVGDGPDRSALAGAELVGWVEDVRRVWWAAEMFALPTEAETTALSLVEAMATGLPGVTSALETFRERGVAGVTLVDNDFAAWARALRALVEAEPATRRAAGQQAREWACAAHDIARAAVELGAVLDDRSAVTPCTWAPQELV